MRRVRRGDRALGERLREAAPLYDGAAARGWEAVRAEAAAREPVARAPRRRTTLLRTLIALAAVAFAGAVALSPAGARVSDLIGGAIGASPSRPAAALPTPGKLLVSGRGGSWIVGHDLKTVPLAESADADWSAKGNYVLLDRGDQLVVRDAHGRTYWTLDRPRLNHLAWSGGDGYRVAYRSGRALRVAAGDGSGDRVIDSVTASVTPAWRPGDAGTHVLAYGLPGGRLVLRDVDAPRASERVLVGSGPPVEALAWVAPGRLLVLRGGGLLLVDEAGRAISRLPRPERGRFTALTASPASRTAAFVRRNPHGATSVVWTVSFPTRSAPATPTGSSAAAPDRPTAPASAASARPATGQAPAAPARPANARLLGGEAQIAFAGAGRIDSLAFSPDGRWLAFAWPPSDQWIFQRVVGRPRLMTVANATRRLGHASDAAGSAIVGWAP